MILYYPKFELSIFLIIPLIFFGRYLYNYNECKKIYEYKNNMALVLLNQRRAYLWGIMSVLFAFIIIVSTLDPIITFNSGDYETVEGYV